MPAQGLHLKLWCLVKGDESVFCVTVPMTARVAQLKELIHRKKERGSFRQLSTFSRYGTSTMCYVAILRWSLSQVDMALESQQDKFSGLSFSPEHKDVTLVANPWDPVSDFWTRQPSELHLHIFVILPGVRFYVQTAPDRLSQFLWTWIPGPLSAYCRSLPSSQTPI